MLSQTEILRLLYTDDESAGGNPWYNTDYDCCTYCWADAETSWDGDDYLVTYHHAPDCLLRQMRVHLMRDARSHRVNSTDG